MAKKKGTRITNLEMAQMYALYQALGSFELVGKKMRRSPDTVSKYVKIYDAAIAGVALAKNSGYGTGNPELYGKPLPLK